MIKKIYKKIYKKIRKLYILFIYFIFNQKNILYLKLFIFI